MNSREMTKEVLDLAHKFAGSPEPPADDLDMLKKMAIVSTAMAKTSSDATAASANYAIFRTAYELGKSRGCTSPAVEPEEDKE